jgi:hypothetical protein
MRVPPSGIVVLARVRVSGVQSVSMGGDYDLCQVAQDVDIEQRILSQPRMSRSGSTWIASPETSGIHNGGAVPIGEFVGCTFGADGAMKAPLLRIRRVSL